MNNTKTGDLFITTKGELGIFIEFEGKLRAVTANGITTDIREIRSPKYFTNSVDITIWNLSKPLKNDTTFLGVSYNCSPTVYKAYKDNLTNYIEYDTCKSLYENNSILTACSEHIIIPPFDFDKTHIIGQGLYNQIMERRKLGLSSKVVFDYGTYKIKKVFKLERGNSVNYAYVIFE